MSKFFRALAAVAIFIGANGLAEAQGVNLTPTLLTIPPLGTGFMTATLSQPASGDTAITIAVSDPTVLAVPSPVIVPNGSSSVTFQVLALAGSGTVTVTAIFQTFMASSQVSIGTGRSVTVSPPDVAIPAFGSATLTATLSSPAPAGGVALSVEATPAGALQTPSVVTVPVGLTSVNFTVTAVVSTGVVTVSVSDGQASGAALVTIGTVTPNQCQIAVNNALAAADFYKSKLQLIPALCVQASNACTAQVADADAALSQLSKLERTVKNSCTRPPR